MQCQSHTYGEKEIHGIHQTQYNVGNIVKAVDISRGQKSAGNDVVGQHLVMILPPLFNVDDENLLQQEGQLHQEVPLHQT